MSWKRARTDTIELTVRLFDSSLEYKSPDVTPHDLKIVSKEEYVFDIFHNNNRIDSKESEALARTAAIEHVVILLQIQNKQTRLIKRDIEKHIQGTDLIIDELVQMKNDGVIE